MPLRITIVGVIFSLFGLCHSFAQSKSYTHAGVWLKALQSSDSVTRVRAAYTFDFSRDDSLATSDSLINGLRTDNLEIRRQIIYALSEFQITPTRTITVLADQMTHEDNPIMLGCISKALAKFGQPAVPKLVEILKKEYPPLMPLDHCHYGGSLVSAYAALALSRIGFPALKNLEPPNLREKGHYSRYYEFVHDEIYPELTMDQMVEFYDQGVLFQKLLKLMETNASETQIKTVLSDLRPLLNNEDFLRQESNPLKNPLYEQTAAQLISLMLDDPKKYPGDFLYYNSGLVKTPFVVSKIIHRLALNPNDDRLNEFSRIFTDKDSVFLPLSAWEDLIKLICCKDSLVSAHAIRFAQYFRTSPNDTSARSGPIVDALLGKAEKTTDNSLQGCIYDILKNFTDVEKARTYLTNGLYSSNSDILERYFNIPDSLKTDNKTVTRYLLQVVTTGPKKKTGKYGPRTIYQAALKQASLLDSSSRTQFIPLYDKILTDISGNPNGTQQAGLTLIARSGKQYLKLLHGYAAVNDTNKSALAGIIGACYDASPEWNDLLNDILSARDDYIVLDITYQLEKIRIAGDCYKLLPALVLQLERYPAYCQNFPAIIHNMGDTVVPALYKLYKNTAYPNIYPSLLFGFSSSHRKELDSLTSRILNNGNTSDRQMALLNLRYRNNRSANLRYLEQRLFDPDEEIEDAAYRAIPFFYRDLPPDYYKLVAPEIEHMQNQSGLRRRLNALLATVNLISGDTTALLILPGSDILERQKDFALAGYNMPVLFHNDKRIIPLLVELTHDAEPVMRKFSVKLLALADSGSVEIRKALIERLNDEDPDVAFNALQSLQNLKIPLHDYRYLITRIYENQYLQEMEDKISSNLSKISSSCGIPLAAHGWLPPLAWPPPPASTRDVIPAVLLTKEKTLGQVYTQLSSSLKKCHYEEFKLFDVKDGFAVMTRLERIDKNGAPSTRERWTTLKLTPISISEYIRSLLLGSEGDFRTILFIISPLPNFRDNGLPMLTTDRAVTSFREGGVVLPPEVSAETFAGKYVHVLIYQFYKKNGDNAGIVYDPNIVIPTLTQLSATDIIKNISN